MHLELIRKFCETRAGGLRKLAADINMSEANLHRCINNNKIQADDLAKIALLLGKDIQVFFDGDEDKSLKDNDLQGEVKRLQLEVKRLKFVSADTTSDRLYNLLVRFMDNQTQYHEIMREMAEIYKNEK